MDEAEEANLLEELEEAKRVQRNAALSSGQMRSTLMGSLQTYYLLTEVHLGTPVKIMYLCVCVVFF